MADAAHAADDIWHRSLEDLLKAIETAEARASSVSFAINLQASTAPIAMPVRNLPHFEKLRVYQLKQLGSDNLPRFQLRLGIIESDLEADAILSTVRKYYPTATKQVIGEADRTAIAQAVNSAQSEAPPRAVAKVSPMPQIASKEPVAPPNAKTDAVVEPRWDIDELLPNLSNPVAPKRERSVRADVTSRIHQPGRSGAAPVRLPDVPVARPANAAIAKTAAPPSIPVVQKAAAAVKRAEVVSTRPAGAPATGSVGDSGLLRSLAATIGTLTDSAPAAPVVPKAPPAAKPAEAVIARAADAPATTSIANSGRLRSLAAKFGTLTASAPATPVVPKAPPAAKPPEAVTPRAADAPVTTSIADSGRLRSLAAKFGALTASAPATPVVPKPPPAAKPPEAVTPRAADTPPTSSIADSGTLQSLVAKIGTLVDAVETHAEATAAPRLNATPVTATATVTATAAAAAVGSPRVSAPAVISTARTAVRNVLQRGRPQTSAPRIDSTQTFRALTAVELSDAQASQWFVIQLMQSQELIDPEQVPKLDIFTEYRLYSVCEPDQGQPVHTLRLGFFSSEIAAQAVAGYLNAHFPTTNIKRVSIAERDRFAEVVAKKDVGETGNHAVIEFSAAPSLPTPAISPAPTPSEADKRPGAASFWSRLTRRGA